MRLVIIDKVHEYLPTALRAAGFEVCDMQTSKPEDIKPRLHEFDGIIIRSKIKLSSEILSNLPNLKFIARVGAGMESIDAEYALQRGIKLMNAPEGNRNAVAEHAVGLILNLLNKICVANAQINAGIWNREANRGYEIMGKTVGIIGYGNTGSTFASKLKSWGVKIIAYDKYKHNFGKDYVTEVDLNTIFEQSDILSLHIPLTDETRYMVDNEFINNFKKDIYIINTARGKIIKTVDLVENLKSNKLLGAALDVVEYEGISFDLLSTVENDVFDYLKKSEKVILTPHVAGITYQSYRKLSEVIARKVMMQNHNL